MSRLRHYLRRSLTLPPHVVALKASRRIAKSIRIQRMRRRDERLSSYLGNSSPAALARFFRLPAKELLDSQAHVLELLASQAISHEFDLLGSGPVRPEYGARCRGFGGHSYPPGRAVAPDAGGAWLDSSLNRANVGESRRIWSLVDAAYRPIDWQLDFKSGHRWPAHAWYLDISPASSPPGADIKVPWELARCQHLPQLALAYARGLHPLAGLLPGEFRNEVLDFISTNPPRFGVNWVCAMDVAIRVANWLVAYDLFRAAGFEFDAPFEGLFARSVHEHAAHVAANLEWTEGARSNHYLADICGLLFASAYLPAGPETDEWLALSLQELLGETELQFTEEGTGIEASTCYHRLSGEMIVYASALALALPERRVAALISARARRGRFRPSLTGPPVVVRDGQVQFPDWFGTRIRRMARFSLDITKPTGTVPHIGDNDSGRFLKLPGTYSLLAPQEARRRYSVPDLSSIAEGPRLDEETLDHRHFVAAAEGLFAPTGSAPTLSGREIDTEVVRSLAGRRRLSFVPHEDARRAMVGSPEALSRTQQQVRALPERQRERYEFLVTGGSLLTGLETIAYPSFGLFVIRSSRLYLAVRCGRLDPRGSGAHAHHDQLAIELVIDGRDHIQDPGTFVYTPLPEARNRYRSAAAHFAPRVESAEPGDLHEGLFVLKDYARADCHYFGPLGFAGQHGGFGAPVFRAIAVQEDRLIVEDGSLGAPLERLPPDQALPISNKYGCLLR